MGTGASSAEVLRETRQAVLDAIDRAVADAGGDTRAVKPGHRVKFHWPPHPISYEYHVLASDWSGRTNWDSHGEIFEIRVARTPNGVFGRCDELWLEAMGETTEEMLQKLAEAAEPLFKRQRLIARLLGREGRFDGSIRDLAPPDLVRLLYAEDRDVANDARSEIETHASLRVFFPALLEILRDRRHPFRRSAQWCVLDLFEDLPAYSRSAEDERQAIQAIRDLIWDSEDDYARTIYKAGVVLGGHAPQIQAAEALLECLDAPHRYGRRSAIHGLFHVAEWHPDLKDRVVVALRRRAEVEPEPVLAEFAELMARDIAAGYTDHIPEPVFPEER